MMIPFNVNSHLMMSTLMDSLGFNAPQWATGPDPDWASHWAMRECGGGIPTRLLKAEPCLDGCQWSYLLQVTGLVGFKLPKFTIFGDTMNTASRMESTCLPGTVSACLTTDDCLMLLHLFPYLSIVSKPFSSAWSAIPYLGRIQVSDTTRTLLGDEDEWISTGVSERSGSEGRCLIKTFGLSNTYKCLLATSI